MSFDELFDPPVAAAPIAPFRFLCANFTEHGQKLQQFFKKPATPKDELLYDRLRTSLKSNPYANLYLKFKEAGGVFVDEPVKDCPILSDQISITDSCALPCGHVLSKTAVNGILAAHGNPIECPFCKQKTNIAFEMCPDLGYGPISGGKKKPTRKNKHKMKKSRKARKSRKSRRSYRKH
jgi:hypothetical protein